MRQTRTALVSLAIGLALLAMPYPLYLWSRATDRLVREEQWWARGMSHGPWRQEWEAVFVLIPIYGLLLGALVLAVSSVALAFRLRRLNRLWALGGVACCYFAFLAIQAMTVYWTIR
jgi:hypothetical protein